MFAVPDTPGIVNALSKGDLSEICIRMFNVLEMATNDIYPDLEELKRVLRDNFALGAIMSGSGSTIFGIFKTYEKASRARDSFSDFPVTTYIVNPIKNIF